MDEQQQILAMILDARAAGKNEDELLRCFEKLGMLKLSKIGPSLRLIPDPTVSESYAQIDKPSDEIEWIFPDEGVDVQNEQQIETSPVSVMSHPTPNLNDWEIGKNNESQSRQA